MKSYEEFHAEVETARSSLVHASVWYAMWGGPGAKELSAIVSELVGWCEDHIPAAKD